MAGTTILGILNKILGAKTEDLEKVVNQARAERDEAGGSEKLYTSCAWQHCLDERREMYLLDARQGQGNHLVRFGRDRSCGRDATLRYEAFEERAVDPSRRHRGKKRSAFKAADAAELKAVKEELSEKRKRVANEGWQMRLANETREEGRAAADTVGASRVGA